MVEKNHRIILGLILLLGAVLLFVNLGKYDVWGDEALTFPKGHNAGEVLKYLGFTGGLVHPPLYSLVQFYWVKLVGFDTAANRVIWACFGLVNILLIYLIGKDLFNRKIGLAASLLCATSPFLVQYSRMIRYYTLTTLIVLLVIWLFARFRRTGRWKDWAFFTAGGAILVYQDYLGFFVLVFLYIYIVFDLKNIRQNLTKWLLTPAVIFLLFLPWLPTLLNQVGKNAASYPEHEARVLKEAPRIAQKSVGVRSLIFNSVLKAGFLYYTFCLGETVYFWRWFVTLPVLTVFSLLVILAFRWIRGPDATNFRWLLFDLTCVGFVTIIFSEIYGIFGSRMFQFPSKVMFLLPLFLLIVAGSWTHLRRRSLQVVSAVIILGGNSYGLFNYYTGQQYLNPKFLAPWRQIQKDVEAQAESNGLILTDEEAFLHQLRISRCSIETFGLVGALEEIQKVRLQGEPLQVFLVIRYRGEETITTEGLIVRDELKALYPLVETRKYVPMDPEVAPFWKRMLGKEPNPYLVEMYHFRVAGPPAAPTTVNLETEHAAQTEP